MASDLQKTFNSVQLIVNDVVEEDYTLFKVSFEMMPGIGKDIAETQAELNRVFPVVEE